jgi:predicted outer membrane repeat protein
MENTITFFSSLCNNFRKLLKSFKKNHAGRESIVKLNAILLSLFLGGFFNGFTGNVAQSQNPCTDEIIEWKVNMTIESPMTISGNTLLLIHPGILIEFTNPDAKLVIFGSIEAIGSETQTISFFSDHPDGWGGIDIDNAGPSTFKYCNFSNINRITRYEDSDINPGGIIITMTPIATFENCNYFTNKGGIKVANATDFKIENCNFINNDIGGINHGLLYLYENTNGIVDGCIFHQNKTNQDGILALQQGSGGCILNNQITNTTYYEINTPGFLYPVLKIESGPLAFNTSEVVIMGNTFARNNLASGSANSLNEIYMVGNDDLEPDAVQAFMWNNNFSGYPFLPPGAAKKTAIYARKSSLTIGGCTIRWYNESGITLNWCDTKIHANLFQSNNCEKGAIRFEKYSDYDGRNIINIIEANTFINNSAENGGAICLLIQKNDLIETVIKNNIFKGNKAKSPYGKGGAIYSENNKDVSIILSNFFENNTAAASGGSIFIENSEDYTISGNSFTENSSILDGGAVYAVSTQNILISENLFENNLSGQNGGAIMTNLSEHITITGNSFLNNQSSGSGGGMSIKYPVSGVEISENTFNNNMCILDGGGMNIEHLEYFGSDPILILQNEFSQNKSGVNGGAVSLALNDANTDKFYQVEQNSFVLNESSGSSAKGGGLYLLNINGDFVSNLFTGNKAVFGGSIYALGLKKSLFDDNEITFNEAASGGGLYLKNFNESGFTVPDAEILIVNNIIKSNYYLKQGGGIYVENANQTIFKRNFIGLNNEKEPLLTTTGGGIHVINSNLEFYNCHFVTNKADIAAVYFDITTQHSLRFHNCNVTNHFASGGLYFINPVDPVNVSIYNSIFYGNYVNSIVTANPVFQPISVHFCYFNQPPTTPSIILDACVLAAWPGWPTSTLTNFYLDCKDKTCVDKGSNDPVFYDTNWPPSCDGVRNDIGITGGPYAMDMPCLFLLNCSRLPEDIFDVVVLDHADRKIALHLKLNDEFDNSSVSYQWFFSDGHYSDKFSKTVSDVFIHSFPKSDEINKVVLAITIDGTKYYLTELVDFLEVIDPLHEVSVSQENFFKDGSYDYQGIHTHSVRIFPNPTNGMIDISVNVAENQNVLIQLYSIDGLLLLSETLFNDSELSTDLSHFRKGIYLIKVSTANWAEIQKVVLQ